MTDIVASVEPESTMTISGTVQAFQAICDIVFFVHAMMKAEKRKGSHLPSRLRHLRVFHFHMRQSRPLVSSGSGIKRDVSDRLRRRTD